MPENVGELLETKQGPPSSTVPQPAAISGGGAISSLKFCAWLDLTVAIIGAIWIWAQFGTTTGEYAANPISIAIGFAVLLQGVFACSFFLVIASIAENLIAIRRNTQPK